MEEQGQANPLQFSWASVAAQMVRIHLQCGRPGFDPWAGRIPWRKEQLPTPLFLPGEFCGQRSLAGYRRRGRKELHTTEGLTHTTEMLVICCLMIHAATPQKSFPSSSPICQMGRLVHNIQGLSKHGHSLNSWHLTYQMSFAFICQGPFYFQLAKY